MTDILTIADLLRDRRTQLFIYPTAQGLFTISLTPINGSRSGVAWKLTSNSLQAGLEAALEALRK